MMKCDVVGAAKNRDPQQKWKIQLNASIIDRDIDCAIFETRDERGRREMCNNNDAMMGGCIAALWDELQLFLKRAYFSSAGTNTPFKMTRKVMNMKRKNTRRI
jgi:hypothetical protein